ncbi:hypothetical protein [Sphingomonas sp. CFBP 8760]|uniref:hypothetical protein n=1 Tax=Sphingomonas sp. CFBP 8760 TaxID=2775282 RepID=UPI001786F50B|nr:hypothetical protein [Sphingomonas sp. CFBP 8760]MBD8548689.1 hypothetical protein [Sphingomonas sp. CFBP 8760]
MRTSSKALAAALLAATAVAVTAQDRPESILPPGFGDPAPPPRPAATRAAPPRGTPTPAPRATATGPAPASTPVAPTNDPAGAVVQPLPLDTPSPSPTASPTPVDRAALAAYEMPLFARRSLSRVGATDEVAADAFGDADGGYLEALMRRTAAPLPSRWLSILLRRTLTAELDTPAGLNGADYAAERAWLLLRMGESVAAQALVQRVDNADYTPKLYQVALNAMLATGDPAGLCPLADAGLATTREGAWALAQPICAALAGNGRAARAGLAAVRRRRFASDIDLRLAQKVIGAGGQGRQAVTIEWDMVDRLTIWRFGLAAATGAAMPDALVAAAGPQVTGWRALLPMLSPAVRLAAAETAAAQGVLSNVALVDLYGVLAADDDTASTARATAEDLRTAYADADAAVRLAALRRLWGGEPNYARLVLTARAAVRQPVRGGVEEVDRLVAAMLAAGLDRSAARWAGMAPAGSDAWAMIALADPDARRRFGAGDVQGYGGGDVKRRLFFAGLAGLGRIATADVTPLAQELGVPIGTGDSWTRALDRAVDDGQPGTVALLAATGMQAAGWRGVPPAALYRIVAALRAVGLEGEARMIAAEAIARA